MSLIFVNLGSAISGISAHRYPDAILNFVVRHIAQLALLDIQNVASNYLEPNYSYFDTVEQELLSIIRSNIRRTATTELAMELNRGVFLLPLGWTTDHHVVLMPITDFSIPSMIQSLSWGGVSPPTLEGTKHKLSLAVATLQATVPLLVPFAYYSTKSVVSDAFIKDHYFSGPV